MEPVNSNNDTNDHSSLRAFYWVGLLFDLVIYFIIFIFSPAIMLGLAMGGKKNDPPLVIHFMIAVMIDAVGWIGYYADCSCPMLVYGIALFLHNVYVLVWILEWGMDIITVILVIRLSFPIPVLMYAQAVIRKEGRMSDEEESDEAHSAEPTSANIEAHSAEPTSANIEAHSAEPANSDNDTECLRILYLTGLSVSLVLSAMFGPVIFASIMIGSSGGPLLFTHSIITILIEVFGWIGYRTRRICPVVIYGIASFLRNVYVLIWAVDSEMDIITIILVIHLSFPISVLIYAYALIEKKWRMSHVETNIEAHSMEPVNVDNKADSMEPVNVNNEADSMEPVNVNNEAHSAEPMNVNDETDSMEPMNVTNETTL